MKRRQLHLPEKAVLQKEMKSAMPPGRGDGTVSTSEFIRVWARLGVEVAPEEAAALFNKVHT